MHNPSAFISSFLAYSPRECPWAPSTPATLFPPSSLPSSASPSLLPSPLPPCPTLQLLAQNILNQRTDVETFLLDSIALVRREIAAEQEAARAKQLQELAQQQQKQQQQPGGLSPGAQGRSAGARHLIAAATAAVTQPERFAPITQ